MQSAVGQVKKVNIPKEQKYRGFNDLKVYQFA
jgi:hypothetical protein